MFLTDNGITMITPFKTKSFTNWDLHQREWGDTIDELLPDRGLGPEMEVDGLDIARFIAKAPTLDFEALDAAIHTLRRSIAGL